MIQDSRGTDAIFTCALVGGGWRECDPHASGPWVVLASDRSIYAVLESAKDAGATDLFIQVSSGEEVLLEDSRVVDIRAATLGSPGCELDCLVAESIEQSF